jgi:glycosyltransferase involved in cell wall biosynthesis
MIKALFVCPYPHGRAPSQRFRFEQYLDSLEVNYDLHSFWSPEEWPRIYQDGSIKYKVLRTIAGFWRRLLLLGQVRKYDKVFIHREATPIGPPWFEWAVAKLFRKKLIFDFDDAIWLPNSSKANEKLAGKLKFHGKTAWICSWATTVITGNEFLANYARAFCNDVRIIPTTIDTEHHHNPDLYVHDGTKWVKKADVAAGDHESDEELLAASCWPLADDRDRDNLGKEKVKGEDSKHGHKSDEEPLAASRLPLANQRESHHHSKTDKNVSPSVEGVAPTKGGAPYGLPTVAGDGNLEDNQSDTELPTREDQLTAGSLKPAASQQSTKSSNTNKQPEATRDKPEAGTKQPAASQQSTKSSNTKSQPEADSLQPEANPNEIEQTEQTSLNTQYSIPNTTIGWTGSHSTLKQLIPLFPLLEEIHAKSPFRFLLIADIPPDTMPDFVEFRKWKKETEIEDLLEMDIGIMPLYDTDWERGKCGFKALQYQALRIPAIVSSVGVNTEIVVDGRTGYCCESFPLGQATQWKAALSDLLQNPEKREEMGHAARQHVIDNYSVRSQETAFREVLVR